MSSELENRAETILIYAIPYSVGENNTIVALRGLRTIVPSPVGLPKTTQVPEMAFFPSQCSNVSYSAA
jgi:hypothetical protein